MNEVLLTSTSGTTNEKVKVWDSKTGTCIMSYRGEGVIPPKGLSVLGSDYVVAVEKLKPLLKVWPINSQQYLHSPRLLCPGRISVVACSPDGCYIAVGIEEKLHVYQVASGILVGSGAHHFQSIVVIRWCCDGSIIACGGEDGIVTVWYLSNLIQPNPSSPPEPYLSFNDHTLPVTDLIFTSGGSNCTRSRLVSVSCDRTCKLYELNTGKLLLTIVFGDVLTSVSMSPSEMEVYVGTTSGDINEFSLRNPKNLTSSEIHMDTSLLTGTDEILNVFSGHKKSVTCLSMSLEGKKLLSGSADETIRIWHLLSKQCLKIITVKGTVTNAFFMKMPKQMLENEVKRNIMLCPFQKTTEIGEGRECNLEIICNNDLTISDYDIDRDFSNDQTFSKKRVYSTPVGEDNQASEEIIRLRSINEQLYKIAMKQLLNERTDVASIVEPPKNKNHPKLCDNENQHVSLKNGFDVDESENTKKHKKKCKKKQLNGDILLVNGNIDTATKKVSHSIVKKQKVKKHSNKLNITKKKNKKNQHGSKP